ncbi:MAG: hemolysin family protein [Eubacteriales bacterium]|nr:hemolysin family protein [Eubacteriales bacterium]
MIQPIILLIVLIFLNATFASAEIAVISMNEAKLRKMAGDGDRRAKKLTSLTEQPARFLATIQVAITLAGLLQSAFAAENFAGPLVRILVDAGVTIPENILKSASIVVITLILAYFNLVFGELVPKRIAMKKAESMALGMSGMLYTVAKVFAPLVWLLTASTNGILRLLGMNPDEEDEVVTEEEILMMLMEGNEQGTIHEEENEIIQNVFEFDDISVEEICTHRREVTALSMDDSDREWAETIHSSRHTYYPVYGKNLDDIIGVLDTKDYFRSSDKSRANILENAVDEPFLVPETMRANVLFRKMKESRIYFSIVLDEYGGLSGIVTLHDLMESLVGELNEKEEPWKPEDIEEAGQGKWNIQGCALLDDVADALKVSLPVETYDTFSGFVCGVIGRIPNDGEQFTCETKELTIEVHEVVNHMIGAATVMQKQI